MISSLTCWLFISILYTFYMFGDLPEYFSIINLRYNSTVVRGQILYDFGLLKFVETCFMAQHMVCPGECSVSV